MSGPRRGARPSGTSGRCRSRSRCAPCATTRPSTSSATSSTWSRSSGLVVRTIVVRPSRIVPSRSAIRASVCASTAEVGSSRTSTSGSACSERASASRCRCPPDRERPRSGRSVSSPSESPSMISSASAAVSASASETRPAPGDLEVVEHACRRTARDPCPATRIRRRMSLVGSADIETPPTVTSPGR